MTTGAQPKVAVRSDWLNRWAWLPFDSAIWLVAVYGATWLPCRRTGFATELSDAIPAAPTLPCHEAGAPRQPKRSSTGITNVLVPKTAGFRSNAAAPRPVGSRTASHATGREPGARRGGSAGAACRPPRVVVGSMRALQ